MITLILTRHGETDWNRQGKLAGSNDLPILTNEGLKQASALAIKLKNFNIETIYRSKLKRAIQTASIISKTLGKRVKFSSALNERSWGKLEGKEWQKNKKRLVQMYESNKTSRPRGGETFKEFKKRILEYVENILEKNEGKTILLVTHGGVIRTIIKIFKNIPEEEMENFRVYNTSLTIFKINEGKIEEELLADIKHLKN